VGVLLAVGESVAVGTTDVLVGVRLGVRVFVGEGGGDVLVAVAGPGVGVRVGVLVAAPGVGVRVRVGVSDAVGVRDGVGVGPVGVRVGVAVRVGVLDAVAVGEEYESLMVQPLLKVRVRLTLPRIPPGKLRPLSRAKSVNQVIVVPPAWTTLAEPLVGEE